MIKARLAVLLFTIPFMVLDAIAMPFVMVYWVITGKLPEPLTQQLYESLGDLDKKK